MKNLFIMKKTIIAVAFIFTASVVPVFAQWDTTSGGNYTGGWDTTSGGNYTGGWDTTSGGNYTGGWDGTPSVNYTGGWDTASAASYTAVPYTTTSYTVQDYSSYPTTYTTGATSYTVPNYSSYPTTYGGTGSYVAPTYVTTPNTVTTTPGTVITNVNCPSGTTQSGNTCINNVNGNVVTNINCPSDSVLTNGKCINNVNGTVVTNFNCPAGTVLTNNQCLSTITPPVVTVNNCPSNTTYVNNTCQQIVNPTVVTYQTCWNGSVIPTTSVCPLQYKTCPNGTSVHINQVCYSAPTPVYVAPPVVRFNNVVTSVATEISKTSGRCNGIGLIANNAPSTGWFEYGETPSLGRTTATANIGQANTAPFSNVLTSLKPSTRYYCRAVMQNQYGLVKGEIVSFITKATVVSYVKPVTVRPVVTHTTIKKPVVNTITCSDGSTVKTKSTSSATLLNQGEKLIAVQVEKLDGNLTSGNVVRYKVTYKNLADTRLSGVLIKVTLPQEIVLAGATAGNYDLGTRTLTLNQDTVDPYTEGVIMITGNVQKDAPVGKTVVMNVYVAYTVPGTSTQDEVTAYVVGSIMPNTVISGQDTGAKKVIGQNAVQGFMPNTLIEWLALLAIMFIIFILGRSVYASYKDDEGSKHH